MKMIAITAMLIMTGLMASDRLTPSSKSVRPAVAVTVICASAKSQYNWNQFGIIGSDCRVL